MAQADIPSPIDLKEMSDAREWERTAMQRPFREEFFEAIAGQLLRIGQASLEVLELGSGPGFLAQRVLSHLPDCEMALLDSSPAMHELARQRLGGLLDSVRFIERSFKEAGWGAGLGEFDAVLTVQAVHELRHKRHAAMLHRQVRGLLKPSGVYLVCDHYCGSGGMQDGQLFMTLDEQRLSLESAGYQVSELLIQGGRALYLAT